MSKIEAQHLQRQAYVYVRQSTMAQVERNVESGERQYELVDRAVAPALVACTSIVPGVPSGNRTIRHGTPPTRRRPWTANRSPHNGCSAAVTVTSPGNGERNSCSL